MKMKRILLALLALMLCMCGALAEQSGAYSYVVLSDGAAAITGYTHALGAASRLNVPASLDGHRVTQIGESAFLRCASLTEIILPEGVVSIGENAFSGCTSLTRLHLPESLLSLSATAFENTPRLSFTLSPDQPIFALLDGVLYRKVDKTLVYYPQTLSAPVFAVPEGIAAIGDHAFYGNSVLQAVVLPPSVLSVGESAFAQCANLKEVVFSEPEEEPNFFSALFDNAASVPLPSSLDGLGDYALGLWDSVVYTVENEDIDLPEEELAELIDNVRSVPLPDSFDQVGSYAASLYEGVVKTFSPDEIVIGRNAFCACASLRSVQLPEKLTTIGSGAFSRCASLSSLYIGETVSYIGPDAFSGCASDFSLLLERDSYARTYARDVGLPYAYPDQDDWLGK